MASLRVRTIARSVACTSRTWLDPDYYRILCQISCRHNAPSSLATDIESRLRISADPLRLNLGNLEIMSDKERRIDSIECRGALDQWIFMTLERVPDDLPSAFAIVDADYDEAGLASIEASVSIVWDMKSSQIAFRIGAATSQVSWHAIAENVLIARGHRDDLLEIRLTDLAIDPLREWSGLR